MGRVLTEAMSFHLDISAVNAHVRAFSNEERFSGTIVLYFSIHSSGMFESFRFINCMSNSIENFARGLSELSLTAIDLDG